MNTEAILGLLGELYATIGRLSAQVKQLTAERDDLLHRADKAPGPTG
jgi:uncharacterized protein YoxC